jgi:hypothetical protein
MKLDCEGVNAGAIHTAGPQRVRIVYVWVLAFASRHSLNRAGNLSA